MAAKTATTKTTTTAPKTRVVRRSSGSASQVPSTTKNYVPDPKVAERYINREIYGVKDFVAFDNALRRKDNILLLGDTGAGKTMVAEAYAAARGMNFIAIPCDVSIDPTAFIGKMMPTETAGKFEWVDGPLTHIFRHGGVVAIDELTFATPKMAAMLYSATDRRRHLVLMGHHGEVVHAHPDTLIIATGNLGSQYRGTNALNAALKNRFKIKVNWGYEAAVENTLITFPTLREVASKLRAMVGVEIMTPVSTNMLMEFEDFALDEDFGLEFAMGNFVAAFEATEAKSVKELLDLCVTDLRRDIAFATGSASDDDYDDDYSLDGSFEVRN